MTTTLHVRCADIETPAGVLRLAVRDDVLVAAAFADHFDRTSAPVRDRIGRVWVDAESDVSAAVRAYVGGDLGAIDDIVVDTGGTDFQRRVWTALRTIPVGVTWSYADLAAAVGSPKAVRAVGSANGANPVWVVVPCHRVIRTSGHLGGYGGGLDRKDWLLRHEGVLLAT